MLHAFEAFDDSDDETYIYEEGASMYSSDASSADEGEDGDESSKGGDDNEDEGDDEQEDEDHGENEEQPQNDDGGRAAVEIPNQAQDVDEFWGEQRGEGESSET